MAPQPVRAAAKLANGLVRHGAWWLRYRMHGHTRPAPVQQRRRTAPKSRSAE